MNILVLANKLPFPPKDGGSIATLGMLEELESSRFHVSCLAINTLKHHYPVEKIPEKYSRRIRFSAVDCDTSVRPFKLLTNLIFSRAPYIAVRFRSQNFSAALEDLLQREKFDLVQLEGPYLGHYIPLLRKFSDAKIVLRAHNIEHQIWKRKAENDRFLPRRLYFHSLASRLRKLEQSIAESCDGLVCISPLDLEYFRNMGVPTPAISVPTGIRLVDYPIEALPSNKSIFFIGALDWMPNVEGLRWFIDEVFHPLCREVPGLVFHVAGRNASPQVAYMFRDERILYHGEVEDARHFMQQYRIMVAPLFTGSGIRIKILESMALGRPVVTTPVGIEGIPALAGRDAAIEEHPEAFRNELVSLLENDEQARQMQSEARKLIQENFDTFELSARLSRFLKGL